VSAIKRLGSRSRLAVAGWVIFLLWLNAPGNLCCCWSAFEWSAGFLFAYYTWTDDGGFETYSPWAILPDVAFAVGSTGLAVLFLRTASKVVPPEGDRPSG
jgi:hypothetical protein